MDAVLFAKGFALGFSIAAPVGPIGLLCLRRSLEGGMLAGFTTGLGAASADFVYGTVAACGLTAFVSPLLAATPWVQLAGGAFLVYLGVHMVRERPATNPAATASRGWLRNFGTAFGLTLTNPMTILSFAAMFAGLGVAAPDRGFNGALLAAAGVFAGSAAWWLLLSAGGTLVRRRIGARQLIAIQRAAGFIVAAFGLYALAGRWLTGR
jgi:threonine/homoserine/homoserine lactone efflux protein